MIGDWYSICTLLSPWLKFLDSIVPEIWRGSKILRVGYVTTSSPLLPNFAYFSLAHFTANLHSKFEVSSFNNFRDKYEVPKF